jgi:hypothetical protein
LIFPGSSATYDLSYDFSTATHNAAHQLFLVQHEEAYDRAFNIHDGKQIKFSELWPKVAESVACHVPGAGCNGADHACHHSYFGMGLPQPPADEAPDGNKIGKEVVLLHSAAKFAQENQKAIEDWVQKYDLDSAAPDYATWDFLDFATGRTWSDLASLDEAKSVGWTEECDTWEAGFKAVFDEMRKDKVIP